MNVSQEQKAQDSETIRLQIIVSFLVPWVACCSNSFKKSTQLIYLNGKIVKGNCKER